MFDPSMPLDERENSYMLASIIGKRAIQLNKGSQKLVECESNNNVTIAINEYKLKKLTYTNSVEKTEYKKVLKEL